MRVVLLALLPLALAQTPTPRPTITPAPESACNYEPTANGPFALDCLQALFINSGCSMRGSSYPTEVDLDEGNGDKGIYNGLTWENVEAKMLEIKDNNVEACRGPETPTPTDEPVASPTTRHPTPAPTRIPTTHTPAPTYADDMAFTELVQSDVAGFTSDTDAATKLHAACVAAGYGRQYDATQYVVSLTMGDFTDYYTFEPVAGEGGVYTSICDMLKDPETHGVKWSDNEYGPFMSVTLASADDKTPDGRVFPSWLDTVTNSGQGYGADDEDDLTAGGDKAYTLGITSLRSFSPCVERIDQEDFVAPCTRAGANGQNWGADAKLCDDGDTAALLYSMANMGFGSCDDVCVYHPDFVKGTDATAKNGGYWYWVSNNNGGCWKPRSDYASGEFQHCNPDEDNFEYGAERAMALERTARLCSERCDHVAGWRFSEGSCYRKIDNTEYSGKTGASNFEKANTACGELATNGFLASIGSKAENAAALAACGNVVCYIGNDAEKKGQADGGWLDGTPIMWANWDGGYEGASGKGDGEDYLTLTDAGTWKYTTSDLSYNALCEAPANLDDAGSNEEAARLCMTSGAASDVMATNQAPLLDITNSGFTDADNPGTLNLIVTIPKYFYNAFISFENSTNDAAEWNWAYGDDTVWTVEENSDPADDIAACEEAMKLRGEIAWTVFNLGGAGGVQRLATWQDSEGTEYTPDSDLGADGYENSKYMFGSVMKIEATQPVFTSIDNDDATKQKREHLFEREVVARIPFVLQFQKTVTVTTDVDIISTKFNFKTVAAIIQSVQYDTQFFAPPYASIKLQIRTKSQYPYLFNTDVSSIKLHPILADTNNDNIDMSIAFLAEDKNCTFTNPDHMREGDICTQEWMLTLIPNANVCYATGEYSVEYEADCFYGKDVCYLPLDSQGAEINTVTFTFKVQTSKFCPVVADEVDLAGTLAVTGRESFKPAEEGAEDNTDGSFYLQGETIHLFATTASEKAVITATSIEMVEIEQDLANLVMTGYNRVPYDADIADMTVWTKAGNGRVADGTVTLNDGSGDVEVELMTDAMVFNSGSTFAGHADFSATEAGFQLALKAKAFPVNVDSFGSKKVIVTLGVEYEALSGLRRRRLLSTTRSNDLRSSTEFRLDSWKPELGKASGSTVTFEMELTLNDAVSSASIDGFVTSFKESIINALKAEATGRVRGTQIVIDAVYSENNMIWSSPSIVSERRKLESHKTIRVVFSMHNSDGAMTVQHMLAIFDKQLRSPASPLMAQPLFYGSDVHSCKQVEAVDSRTQMGGIHSDIHSAYDIVNEESSAIRAVPIIVGLLTMLAMW